MRVNLPKGAMRAVICLAKILARLAVNAVVWLIAFGVFGLASMVAGVGVLFGSGWALIAAGVAFLAAASFIKQGLSNG